MRPASASRTRTPFRLRCCDGASAAAGDGLAARSASRNRTIYEQYGVYAPIFGYMYDRTVVEARTGADGPRATLSLAGLTQPLIEPEIVFKVRSTPPRTDEPRRC